MADLGYPIRMKFIPSLAYSVTRHRPTAERPPKAPGRNWTKALEKRHKQPRGKPDGGASQPSLANRIFCSLLLPPLRLKFSSPLESPRVHVSLPS
jgi:hypothetical protein